jgi:SAM-dependent methyltransferase
MNAAFDAYAAYYDLLYRDKDYAGEAAYVAELLKRHAPEARRLLELGCGTGGHALELAGLGFEVTGIDVSGAMVTRAQERAAVDPRGARCRFEVGDLRAFETSKTYDAALALFHVISYQTSNDDLLRAFRAVSSGLRPGGLFVFDVWHGPGVLTDPPAVRIKRAADSEVEVTRIAEPTIDALASTVDVRFEVFVRHTRGTDRFVEHHRMRYLFATEIDLLLSASGLERLACHAWRTQRAATCDDWYACVIARKQ